MNYLEDKANGITVRWWKKPKDWEAVLLNQLADMRDLLVVVKNKLELWETDRLNDRKESAPTPLATTDSDADDLLDNLLHWQDQHDWMHQGLQARVAILEERLGILASANLLATTAGEKECCCLLNHISAMLDHLYQPYNRACKRCPIHGQLQEPTTTSQGSRPITAKATTDFHSAVQDSATTPAITLPSQPLPTPVDKPSGLAELSWPCAHVTNWHAHEVPESSGWLTIYCQTCGASGQYVRTPVPAAATTQSIYQRQGSTSFVQEQARAESGSGELTKAGLYVDSVGRDFFGHPEMLIEVEESQSGSGESSE